MSYVEVLTNKNPRKYPGIWIGLFVVWYCLIQRQSPVKNFASLTRKHYCRSLFFNKVAGLRYSTLSKKTVQHSCFRVNFTKCLRILFSHLLREDKVKSLDRKDKAAANGMYRYPRTPMKNPSLYKWHWFPRKNQCKVIWYLYGRLHAKR